MNAYINPFSVWMIGSKMLLLEHVVKRFRHKTSSLYHTIDKPPDQIGSTRPSLLEVNKWSTSKYILRLLQVVGHEPYPLDELMLMAAAFEYHRPEIVIDIGTHVGKSARIWFELSKELQIASAIHTIELNEPSHVEYPGRHLGHYIRGLPVEQHIGDGATVARSIIGASPMACFLLFLDGDHSYETVRRELQVCQTIKRGCVLVHDTFYQPSSNYNHGPYLAIQNSLSTLPVKQVVHLQTGLPGMSYLSLD